MFLFQTKVLFPSLKLSERCNYHLGMFYYECDILKKKLQEIIQRLSYEFLQSYGYKPSYFNFVHGQKGENSQ